jgi:hypothetical protein
MQEKGRRDNTGILELTEIWTCHRNNVNNQLLLTS